MPRRLSPPVRHPDLSPADPPASPAAALHERGKASVRAPGIGSWSFLPVGLVAGAVALLVPTAMGVVAFLETTNRDGWAGLFIVAGLAFGALASPLGMAAGALSARALRWHSRRAMWIAGLCAGAGVLPALAVVGALAIAL